VIISRYAYYYGLAEYLRLITSKQIVFALGIPNLRRLLEEQYYQELDGGILEAFGRLFKTGVKIWAYPYRNQSTGEFLTAENLPVPGSLSHLYSYLIETGRIASIRKVNEANLHILPKEVLGMIQSGNPDWEKYVPAPGVKLIKERGVFGYKR
jgi:hypothetical protein